jgi:predicted Rdx family selenoprotein
VEAELRTSYPDSSIQLIEGSGGIFDVKYNGRVIYSKQNTAGQRFPDNGEITRLIGQEKD